MVAWWYCYQHHCYQHHGALFVGMTFLSHFPSSLYKCCESVFHSIYIRYCHNGGIVTNTIPLSPRKVGKRCYKMEIINNKNLKDFFNCLKNCIDNGNIKTFNKKDLEYWKKEVLNEVQ